MRLMAVLFVAALVAACSGSDITGASQDPAQYVGTWAQRGAVSGTVFVVKLSVQGSDLAGTGTYRLDDGRTGPVTGTGTLSNGTLQLALTYNSGQQAQFSGQRSSSTVLSGSLHFGPAQSLTPSAVVSFDRTD